MVFKVFFSISIAVTLACMAAVDGYAGPGDGDGASAVTRKRIALAKQAMSDNDLKRALSLYEMVARGEDAVDVGLLGSATILLDLERYDEAEIRLLKLIENDEFQVDARLLMVDLLFEKGDRKGAQSYLRHVEALRPNYAQLDERKARLQLLQGRYDSALELVEKSIARSKVTQSTQLKLRGQINLSLKRYAQAIRDFDRLIQEHPDQGTYYILKAMALQSLGKKEEATAAAKICEKMSQKKKETYEFLSEFYVLQNDSENAIRWMSAAAQVSAPGGKLSMTIKLARMYHQFGDFDKAVEVLQHLQKVNPGQETVAKEIARTYYLENRFDLLGAYVQAQKANYPKSEWVVLSLAVVLERIGNRDSAKEALKAFVSDNAKATKARFKLAKIYYEDSTYPEAAGILTKLEKEFPDRFSFKFHLALVAERMDLWDEAEKRYIELLDKPGISTKAAVNLAALYEKQKQFNKAIDTVAPLLGRVELPIGRWIEKWRRSQSLLNREVAGEGLP